MKIVHENGTDWHCPVCGNDNIVPHFLSTIIQIITRTEFLALGKAKLMQLEYNKNKSEEYTKPKKRLLSFHIVEHLLV